MATPSSTSSTDAGRPLLEVGAVVRPHGIRGECIVTLVTDRLERLQPGSRLEGRPQCPVGGAPAPLELEVLASKPHQGRFIVSFAGVTDRNGAELLRDLRLFAEPIAGDADTWFVHELIGCELRDPAGAPLGRVVAVEANPASDLLVLENGALVPLRFVVERRQGMLVVDAPDGLVP